jgi:hypothetical protein
VIRQRKPIARRRSVRSGRRKPRLAKLYAGLALSKGNRRAEQDRAAAAEDAHRLHVRGQVFARTTLCECCGQPETRTGPHEAHEVYERSKTRRMAPEARFDRRWTLRVCRGCHGKLQRHELTPLFWDLARGTHCYPIERRFLTAEQEHVRRDTGATCLGWYTAEQVWRCVTGLTPAA